MKAWFKSRTLWFNCLSAFFVVIEANSEIIKPYLEPKHYLLAIGLFAAINAALRFATSQPIK